ncbi:vesicle formation at the endoplasmic reticulum [Metarhizium rileyi]|uniref:tripeptidyl-peptidase II n=1 Tax=Metarhizium rileyi (strain RCEF 4871) TaxID=1649241 RepID=A0A5C6GQK2_METRR|nr:vesicle formation at the endoplasmic reticulum [Metarhizium rileyi]
MKPPASFLCLLGSAVAAVVADFTVVESLDQPPHGWTRLEAANSSLLIRLSISLESEGHEEFEKTLGEVSDPNHSRYGQHLTRDEAFALVPQSQIHERGLFIDVVVAVSTAERLLSTRYDVFQNKNKKAIGTLAYSVPAEVRPHITSIQPTTLFQGRNLVKRAPAPMGLKAALGHGIGDEAEEESADPGNCENNNTPACLRRLYRMKDDYGKPHRRSLLGIAGFNQQAAQFSQLKMYLDKYAKYAKGSTFSVELLNGGTNPQGEYPSGEANMDVQIAVSMAYNVPVRFYSAGGEDHGFIPDLDISNPKKEYIEPWLQFLSHLVELPDENLPQVMSISYGVNEQVVPKAYAFKICQLFGQLALRGMSVILASGDQGPGISCQSNDGAKTTKFLPAFPAGCPYITAVGATEQRFPEKAINFSSGGFSENWPRPAWQEAAVSRYLDRLGDKWKGYFNRKGRGFPDVSAQGIGYPFFNHNSTELGGGTSASAPLFASMIAVINDSRMKKGKAPLGFLNPWLYQVASHAFTDITRGRSEGCRGVSYSGLASPVIPGAGWDAAEGWDPVTGLGTPLFDELMKLAMK